jgi:hypothetical protein
VNSNVAVAIVSGAITLLVFLLTQYYRDKNRKHPPRDTPLPPSTSAEMWEHITNQDARLEDNATQIAEVRRELGQERAERVKFSDAVRRYLELLASAWPGPDSMPDPSESDLDILKPSLPRTRRRKPPTKEPA